MRALLAKMNVSLYLPEGNSSSELDSIWLHFPGLMKLSSTDQTDSDLVCGSKVFNPCLSPLRWGGLRGERPLFVRFQDSLCLPHTICSHHRPLSKAGAPQAVSSATINCISALFLSPDNCWGGMASFRIFSFFPPLLNTAPESASPSRFMRYQDGRRRERNVWLAVVWVTLLPSTPHWRLKETHRNPQHVQLRTVNGDTWRQINEKMGRINGCGSHV